MKQTHITKVIVFAQYGQNGFVRYDATYSSGAKRTYWIHTHHTTKGRRHVPQTVNNFISRAEFAGGEDRTLFMHNGLPVGFTVYEYSICPF